ncbi:DUF4307 domain-containing protein [Mycobacterium sp.]|jgi:hypothetical protein|uniref:DUF4307 domain-containing protein n=1 Tax=Mycobacterium sp. TaxID=1785 RepID=UPI002D5EB531|nr:DUF4307 domain-containing protein [Mycobacterium sp.]HZA11677.1 DUF4307 domain-containing protein [Mycobacterium sp.]
MTEPPTRYRPARLSRGLRRIVVVVIAALVLGAGVVIAIVGYQRLGPSDIEGTMAAYRLIDDETVSVTITVRRSDPSRPAVCIVRARSKDGTETGRRELLVLPSDRASVQVTTTVKASRPPVMGDVYGCGYNVPAYLVAS